MCIIQLINQLKEKEICMFDVKSHAQKSLVMKN